MKESAIIVFDSGFGGISVLKCLVEAMPNEDYLYYGDSANAPYGPRTKEQVQELTLQAIAKASAIRKPKAIVIACNTATAASKEAVQEAYPGIPVIGILPAVQLAVQNKVKSTVLVLATAGTLASEAYRKIVSGIDSQHNVISLPAPAIVEYVEGALHERENLLKNLQRLFAPYKSLHFDSVVLGCTHFPFAADVIKDALGYSVAFFDGGILTTSQTQDALVASHSRNADHHSGSIQFVNSSPKDCLGFAWKLFASNQGSFACGIKV